MYTLYCRKGAGSVAIEAVLALIAAPCEIVDVERDATGALPDFFHRINPRAEVPTLRLPDDSIMTESAAILIHLADSHPEHRLAPAIDHPSRPRFLRWTAYLATTLYMSDLRFVYPERYTLDGHGSSSIKARAAQDMGREFKIYAEALGEGPFILGQHMCVTDIYAAMMVTWVPDMAELFAAHPNVQAMYDQLTAIPAIARVWARNGM